MTDRLLDPDPLRPPETDRDLLLAEAFESGWEEGYRYRPSTGPAIAFGLIVGLLVGVVLALAASRSGRQTTDRVDLSPVWSAVAQSGTPHGIGGLTRLVPDVRPASDVSSPADGGHGRHTPAGERTVAHG